MARGRWQVPAFSFSAGPGGKEFIGGVVPALTPETYDPGLATEEVERAEATASLAEARIEIEALEELLNLDLGGEVQDGYSDE